MESTCILDLSVNENPYCRADKFCTVLKSFEKAKITSCQKLKTSLANIYSLPEQNVELYAGVEDALASIFFAITCSQTASPKLLMPRPARHYYQWLARRFNIPYVQFELKEKKDHFYFDVDELVNEILTQNPSALLLDTPNNPTGAALKEKDLKKICSALKDGFVVIDERYLGFSDDPESNPLGCNVPDNAVRVRGFSKYQCIVGLRIGYALYGRAAAKKLDIAPNNFKLNSVAEEAACNALSNKTFYAEIAEKIKSERKSLYQFFESSSYFRPFRSDANFLLLTTKPHAKDISNYAKFLLQNGVKLKVYSEGDLKGKVRVTIGTSEEMQVLRELTEDYLHKVSSNPKPNNYASK